MDVLLNPKEFLQLAKSENALVFDASFGPDADMNFLNGHLLRAQFVDLETELSLKDKNPPVGGRHPLPFVEEFAEVLGRKGVTRDAMVLIYNQGNVGAAARFWWMLKAIGHSNTHVLNGTLNDLEREGAQLTNDVTEVKHTVYDAIVDDWILPRLSMKEVEEGVASGVLVMVDARAAARYRGEVEPIDPVAGHIPNAVNLPFQELLENGAFLPQQEIGQRLDVIFDGPERKGIYCGSGVTACYLALALNSLGKEVPPVYIGSWSEWCRNNV